MDEGAAPQKRAPLKARFRPPCFSGAAREKGQ